jgi:hypothetical protein
MSLAIERASRSALSGVSINVAGTVLVYLSRAPDENKMIA